MVLQGIATASLVGEPNATVLRDVPVRLVPTWQGWPGRTDRGSAKTEGPQGHTRQRGGQKWPICRSGQAAPTHGSEARQWQWLQLEPQLQQLQLQSNSRRQQASASPSSRLDDIWTCVT